MAIQGRKYTSSSSYRYGFNGKENDDEVKGIGNSLDFGERIYDSRLGRWLTPDPQKQFRLSPYLSFANNPILFTDPDGGWIPGVDDNGRIILTAEKGDNIKTLYSFLGGKSNAIKFLPTVWSGKFASKMEITNGTQVAFNSGNNYSKAMNDVKENPKKYEVTDNDEKNRANDNYNCHAASIRGSKGQEFHNEKPMDDTGERNPILKSDYDNVTSLEVKFGETIITFGDAHSAVFFGKSSDGTSYVFSKQGNNTAPVIVPLIDLVKGNGESPQGNIGNGLVGNPSNFGGKTSYPSENNKVTETGQASGAGGKGIKTSNGTGYFNPKKK